MRHHSQQHQRPAWRRQAGFSFFEVLVAALILGIGVLGFAALQVRALDTTGVSHFRAQAAVLAADLSERMRMVRGDPGFGVDDALQVWEDNPGIPAALPTGNNTCMAQTASILANAASPCRLTANLLRTDVLEMRFLVNELLPGGTVDVRLCEAGSALVCVFIAWRMPAGESAADCELGGGNPNCLALQVLL